jgi:hypothetical protein
VPAPQPLAGLTWRPITADDIDAWFLLEQELEKADELPEHYSAEDLHDEKKGPIAAISAIEPSGHRCGRACTTAILPGRATAAPPGHHSQPTPSPSRSSLRL